MFCTSLETCVLAKPGTCLSELILELERKQVWPVILKNLFLIFQTNPAGTML